MVARELPLVDVNKAEARQSGNGRYGAAHVRPRDAYKDVPILKQPTWNHEIAAYFYLGGVSSGSFVLAALAEMVGGGRFKTLARTAHYVSFATILPCPVLLIDDLGKKSRFHHMLRIFKPSSPMNLGAWTLTAHGAMATLTALRALAGEGKLPLLGPLVVLLPQRPLVAAGLPSALTLGGYTGVLLGTSSVPVWFKSPLLGGLFTASAMSTGIAATSLASTLGGRAEPGEQEVTARLGLISGATELGLLGGYLATSGRAAKAYAQGPTAAMMAAAAVGLVAGTALELAGMRATSQQRTLSVAAATATLAAGALLRWAVVRAGRVSARDRAGTLDAMKPSDKAPGWGATTTA